MARRKRTIRGYCYGLVVIDRDGTILIVSHADNEPDNNAAVAGRRIELSIRPSTAQRLAADLLRAVELASAARS